MTYITFAALDRSWAAGKAPTPDYSPQGTQTYAKTNTDKEMQEALAQFLGTGWGWRFHGVRGVFGGFRLAGPLAGGLNKDCAIQVRTPNRRRFSQVSSRALAQFFLAAVTPF